jgi:hypothetical protein
MLSISNGLRETCKRINYLMHYKRKSMLIGVNQKLWDFKQIPVYQYFQKRY